MITKTNLKIILMQILFGAFLPTGHAKKKMFISKKRRVLRTLYKVKTFENGGLIIAKQLFVFHLNIKLHNFNTTKTSSGRPGLLAFLFILYSSHFFLSNWPIYI